MVGWPSEGNVFMVLTCQVHSCLLTVASKTSFCGLFILDSSVSYVSCCQDSRPKVSVLRLIHCGCGGPALSHPPVVVRLCGQSGQRSRQVMKDGH